MLLAAPLRGGVGGGCNEDGTAVIVREAAFVLHSFVFWRANLRRFDRLGFVASWAEEPRPEIDIAVESDPCEVVKDGFLSIL